MIENVTPDGVLQAPGRPEEDPTDGFAHGGRVVRHDMGEGMEPGAAALLFGRRTWGRLRPAPDRRSTTSRTRSPDPVVAPHRAVAVAAAAHDRGISLAGDAAERVVPASYARVGGSSARAPMIVEPERGAGRAASTVPNR